jgi:O-antigen/teichoic acid export membrane protein
MPQDETPIAEAEPVTGPSKAGGSLKSLVLRGASWTVIGYGVSYAIRLGSSIVLSRLLFREAFGLSALISIYVTALQMFSDLGFGTNIVRSPRGGDPAFLNTAWTMQVIRGFVLWVLSILLAWPVAMLYGQPLLTWLLPVAGLGAAIQGFNSTALFTCTRQLALRRVVMVELVTQVATLAVNVAIALVYPSVWALVIGGLVGNVVKMAMSHLYLPGHRHGFRWEAAAVTEVFAFGRWVFLSTLITFFAMSSDRLVLGKLISMSDLGLYTIALTLALAPRDLFERLANLLAYPVIARFWREPGGQPKVTAVRTVLLAFSALICAPLIGVAQPLVNLLYDQRYHEAGSFLGVMLVGTWLQTVSVSYGVVLLSVGHPKYISLGVAVRTAIFFLLVFPVFRQFGTIGVAVLAAASELGVQADCILGVRGDGLPSLRIDLPFHLFVAVTAVGTHYAWLALAALTGSSAAAVVLLGLFFAAVMGASGLYVFRNHTTLFRRVGTAEAAS